MYNISYLIALLYYYIVATIKGEVPLSTQLGVDVACIILPVAMVGIDTAGDRHGMHCPPVDVGCGVRLRGGLRGLYHCRRRRS